jgi:1-deoxy-D-xylulose-5-phosphate reductoisomerase
LTILGATGSIGSSTLDVVSRHPGRYRVFALSAHHRIDELARLCSQHRPRYAVVADAAAAMRLQSSLAQSSIATEVLHGPQALIEVAAHAEVDSVMAAIVGAAGLPPALAAARAGKKILLANKEALVMAGAVFMQAVAQSGARLLPIDSEHNAVFQSLPADYAGNMAAKGVRRVLLTASGGPFRTTPLSELAAVTPAQACAHPNWVMGRKISVDSATMMNKALEVIEARYLFGLPPRKLDVVIHPQSIIHSMVQYTDTSVVAQLGTPDMRVPIAYGLAWPERVASGAAALDFHALGAMTFEAIDDHGHPERFPGLRLAWEALEAPAGTTAVLNAANEVAVASFLERRIRFDQIHALNLETLSNVAVSKPGSLDDLLALDQQARSSAQRIAQRLA